MNSKIFKDNLLITALTILSVGVNFLSQIVLAFFFGASSERDAYYLALAIPSYVVVIFSGSFSVVILPRYQELINSNDQSKLDQFVTSTFSLALVILIAISIFCIYFSEELLTMSAPGFSLEMVLFSVKLFRVLILSMVFQSLTSYLTLFYHAKSKFVLTALVPVIGPLISIFSVLGFHDHGLISLAYGNITASMVSMLVLLPIVFKNFRFTFSIDFLNSESKTLLKLATPLFVSGLFFRSTTLIERVFASRLETGSISYLALSNQLYVILASIASGSIAMTFYPLMSNAWSRNNFAEVDNYLTQAIRLILLITMPMASILIIEAHPIIELTLQHGAFSSDTTTGVSLTLSILMGAFVFGSLGNVVNRIFYVTKKTTALSLISSVELVLYFLLGYGLSRIYSYSGLAMAFTLSTALSLVTMIVYIRRQRLASLKGLLSESLKIGLGVIVSSGAHLLMKTVLATWQTSLLIQTSISIFVAVLVYLVMILQVAKVKDSVIVMEKVKTFGNKFFK